MTLSYIQQCIKAQSDYCVKEQLPHFAPPNGICWNCKRQIYDKESGFKLERAQSELITGCSHCHRSYCS
jgi:hypothetical protein